MGYDAQNASYDNRDNINQLPYSNSNFCYRQYSPNYQDWQNNKLNGFSLVGNFSSNHYANNTNDWQIQRRYQGANQPYIQNRSNNQGNSWNQGPPRFKRNPNRRQNQLPANNAYNSNIGNQRTPTNGNMRNNGQSDYNLHPPLSSISSFVTHDGVTFDVRRNQNFQNT